MNTFLVCLSICVWFYVAMHFGLFDVAKEGEKMGILKIKILYFQSFKNKHKFKKKGGERDEWTVEQNLYVSSWFQDCLHQKGGDCGSNAFQDYFDDAKDSSQEWRDKQVSWIKESFNQSKFQESKSHSINAS